MMETPCLAMAAIPSAALRLVTDALLQPVESHFAEATVVMVSSPLLKSVMMVTSLVVTVVVLLARLNMDIHALSTTVTQLAKLAIA